MAARKNLPPFHWRRGVLHAEEIALPDLAERVGTPFYCYAAGALQTAWHAMAEALERALPAHPKLICYSLKANSNLALIRLFGREGAGADIVSGGELARALKAKIPPRRIVFSGVGKTVEEMDAALAAGIHMFNVESPAELERLRGRAKALARRAPIALRLNPDIDARTHEKITTGRAENKFGMDGRTLHELARRAHAAAELDLVGLDLHIGSQIMTRAPFDAAFGELVQHARALTSEGMPIARLDVGGGLGIAYDKPTRAPDWRGYAALLARHVKGLPCQLIFEPGRALVARAGLLVGRVLEQKRNGRKQFLIVDASMNELMRPTLYDADHHMEAVVRRRAPAPPRRWDIVGPICESGDFLARGRRLSAPAAGELLAIFDVGAYGAALGSHYNSRPLAPEVLVQGDKFFLVRHRTALHKLWHNESVPPFLRARATR